MRAHVVHAHPVEESFSRALFHASLEALQAAGHEVDALNLYEEDFPAVMTREERVRYLDVPGNLSPAIRPYVERLRAADAVVFVHPVWNYGYPAILKGYFDRIYLPGVTFRLEGGDHGKLVHCLTNIRKAAFVTSYGGDRWRTMLMGDPPRRLARRWAWAIFQTPTPPLYLAFYDIDNSTPERRAAFIGKVRERLSRF